MQTNAPPAHLATCTSLDQVNTSEPPPVCSVPVWERVLWKQQNYHDNYVPPDKFLSSLRRNQNFRPYSYGQLVTRACSITQHLATTFIFLAIFVRLYTRTLDPKILVWTTVSLYCLGFLLWTRFEQANVTKTIKAAILIFITLISLSPVLRTLTAATSSDSIWALSAALFALNALLADYSYGPFERLSSVLSMNAAISASVVLASRLSTDLAVFSLVFSAVQAFALFPILLRRLQTTYLTPPLLVLAIYTIWPLSNVIAILVAVCLFFVTFIAPAALVWAQQFKNELRGPWDVAIPQVD